MYLQRRYTIHMKQNKERITTRLSPKVLELLAQCEDRFGVSRTAIIEMAVREWAVRQGVQTLEQRIYDADEGTQHAS
jgi:hypothetical protein